MSKLEMRRREGNSRTPEVKRSGVDTEVTAPGWLSWRNKMDRSELADLDFNTNKRNGNLYGKQIGVTAKHNLVVLLNCNEDRNGNLIATDQHTVRTCLRCCCEHLQPVDFWSIL